MVWLRVLVSTCFVCVVLAGTCPHTGWKYRDGVCYQLFEEPKNRNDAEATCNKYTTNFTAHLASVNSHDENIFVSTVVAEETIKPTWIGLIGTQNGVFTWTDGATFSFSNWLDGQPWLDNNETASEDCVVTNYNYADYEYEGIPPIPAHWADEDCNQLFPFVCKMRAF